MSTSIPILLRNLKQSAMVFAGLNTRMIAPAIRFLSFIYIYMSMSKLCAFRSAQVGELANRIQVDSIQPIGFPDITPELARESGFLGVLELLQSREARSR